MKIISLIARYLLGFMFTVIGINGFFHFIPEPPQVTPLGIQFWTSATASHFVVFAFTIQALAGVLLLSGFFVPLALILLAAELYNILAYHLTLNPGFAPGIVACVLWVLVFVQYRTSFNTILSPKATLHA
jgi:putative oxidoreductase